MKDDVLRKEIHAELRRIRRDSGVFSKERVATSDLLIDMVGEGSVEHAFTGMLDLLVNLGVEEEGDVRAYFLTCGFELPGDNLDDRLKAYHERFHVDPRTALRRSDRGAAKLSYVIRDFVKYERPNAFVTVIERDGVAGLDFWVEIPHQALWRRPLIYINEELQEGRLFELHDSETDDRFVTGKERWRGVLLSPQGGDEDTLFVLSVHWDMPVAPVWFTGAQLSDPTLLTRIVTSRHLGVEIAILRVLP